MVSEPGRSCTTITAAKEEFAEPDFLIEYAESSSFSGKRDFDTCYM
jgi:hypothetical protein